MTFASFQDFGKWANRRQWINKCERCSSELLGRCLRHSFRIPLLPVHCFFINLIINSLNWFCRQSYVRFSDVLSLILLCCEAYVKAQFGAIPFWNFY
jgi:hypothetical protein